MSIKVSPGFVSEDMGTLLLKAALTPLVATSAFSLNVSLSFINQPKIPAINRLFLTTLQFCHVHNSTDAVSLLHGIEGVVHLAEGLAVGDELVNLEGAAHVVGNEVVHLRTALDTTKGTSLPHTSSDQLESYTEHVSNLESRNPH